MAWEKPGGHNRVHSVDGEPHCHPQEHNHATQQHLIEGSGPKSPRKVSWETGKGALCARPRLTTAAALHRFRGRLSSVSPTQGETQAQSGPEHPSLL